MTAANESNVIQKKNEAFMGQLKRLRIANGLTQTALAKKLKVVPSTVSYWESGLYLPQPKQIPDLAKILGVSPYELTKHIAPEAAPFAAPAAASV